MTGMEKDLVPKEGFRLEFLKLGGIKGKGLWVRLQSIFRLPQAFLEAKRLIERHKPDIVFGIGGYASGPLLLVASLKGIHTAIMEPNAIPGFSNRVLAHFVRRIYIGFDITKARLSCPQKIRVSGNIIKPEILNVGRPVFQKGYMRILIFGGSQGAHAINQAVIEMLPMLQKYKGRLSFIHQTGRADRHVVESAYRTHGFEARVAEFIDDMAEVYGSSHLVIARSGSSVAEIAATGRPSILIPYPYAADNHQKVNAELMVAAKAAILISSSDLDGKRLTQELVSLVEDDARLRTMSQGAWSMRKDKALDIIFGDFQLAIKDEKERR